MPRRGFTLVELLVVISIILILVGLLMAALKVAQRFSRETKVKTHLTMVDQGIKLYYEEYEVYPVMTPTEGTNHLGWQLCNPDPSFAKDPTTLAAMRSTTGFPTRLLVDSIPPARYAQGKVDFSADFPIPIYDGLDMVGPFGSPLIYIHVPTGRRTAEEETANPPESYSAWTHAFEGFEYSYELWSPGEDGIFDEALHDETIPANKDNLTVTRYR